MKRRTPRFVSQFAELDKEPRRSRTISWRRMLLMAALAAAAALAAHDILWL